MTRIALLSAVCLLQPALASAQLIISEFRLRGPNGATDEFIEIYNDSTANHTVAAASGTGYGIAASDGVTRCSIANGTVIPSRGHFLCVNSVNYSLASYPAGNGTTATGNATYTTDIPDNAGIALFNNNAGGGSYILANRLDAVGSTSEANALYKEGAGYPALTPFSINYSFTRRPAGGCTGSGGGANCNSGRADPDDRRAGEHRAGGHRQQRRRLHVRGHQRHLQRRDPAAGSAGAREPLVTRVRGRVEPAGVIGRPDPALQRTAQLRARGRRLVRAAERVVPPCNPFTNSTFGTVDIRQKFANNTGAPITRLRFRIIDITTFPSASGVADLRPITSSDIVDPILGTVRGTTLEQPPSQPNGSGFNGTLSVGAITLGTPLAAGSRVDVRFVMGVQQMGAARFCVAAETLPAASAAGVLLPRPD